jgi:hypothetical protein
MDAEIIFERRSSMKINQLLESLNQQQRSVPQLPAQAKARHIKVLGAKTDPKHPFAGYMVGADESVEPGSKRIGPDRNDPWEKGWRAGFHHTESNPYPAGSKEAKQWDDGYAEAESQPNHYDESVTEVFSNDKETGTTHRGGVVAKTAKGIKHTKTDYDDGHRDWDQTRSSKQDRYKKFAIPDREDDIDEGWKSKLAGAALAGAAALGGSSASAADVNDPSWSKAGYDSHIKADSSLTKTTSSDGVSAPKVSKDLQRRISDVTGPNADGQYRVTVTQNGKIASQYVTKTPPQSWMVKEDITKEDIISKLKARLGDYLGDLSKEIKKDPDLIDKLAAKAPDDQMGPPVKTVTTDDGHEIQIHGNEDDGFRVSIKNKTANSKFKNLDEAVMACEMYCARRRAQAKSADYVDEA